MLRINQILYIGLSSRSRPTLYVYILGDAYIVNVLKTPGVLCSSLYLMRLLHPFFSKVPCKLRNATNSALFNGSSLRIFDHAMHLVI